MASSLDAPGQHEADIRVPEEVASAKLAATGSAVKTGGPYPKLPPNFQKGIAISIFQNSGGVNSNWGRYAEARGKLFGLIPNIMDKSSPNDGACDFWDRCAVTVVSRSRAFQVLLCVMSARRCS
jgi:hypothetical protein